MCESEVGERGKRRGEMDGEAVGEGGAAGEIELGEARRRGGEESKRVRAWDDRRDRMWYMPRSLVSVITAERLCAIYRPRTEPRARGELEPAQSVHERQAEQRGKRLELLVHRSVEGEGGWRGHGSEEGQ